MPSMYTTSTNTLTTQDWLVASKDMKISSYDPASAREASSNASQQPIFGTHIREAIAIAKDWFGEKK